MRKSYFASVAALAVASIALASPSYAAYTGPTSWNTAGLKPVVEETGQISWSIDGLGTVDGQGTLQVNKPAGGTVRKAYLVAAQIQDSDKPTIGSASGILLNGSAVTFQYESLNASGDAGNAFNNYFADVTSLVSSTIDGHAAGTFDINLDEGGLQVEGTELIVLFNDSTVDIATVVLAFGNSSPAGDEFTLAFDALSAPQTQDLQLSLGISYSYDNDGDTRDGWQSSVVGVNGSPLTDIAGSFDDCEEVNPDDCQDGSLLTVGGVGNSTTNPTMPSSDTWSQAADDELYSLTPFVTVGSTHIVVNTRNASANDNIFLDAFYLKHIVATVGDGKLAETGYDPTGLGLGAVLALTAGGAVVTVRRRRNAA